MYIFLAEINEMHSIKRLAVVFKSLAGGGIERMRLHLIHEWRQQGIEIDIVLTHAIGSLRDQVPDDVTVHEVGKWHPWLFPFGLWRYFYRRRPSHVLTISNDIGAFCLLFARFFNRGTPTVLSVHNNLTQQLALTRGLRRWQAYATTYFLGTQIRTSRAVVAVSQGVADDFQNHFTLQPNQLHVIHNPVLTDARRQQIQAPLPQHTIPSEAPWIVFAGRLVHAKGLDILLKAFTQIAEQTSAHLILLGDGPLRSSIETQITRSGLEQRIHLLGFQTNPLPWIREAAVFVLPSRHEGLPNVLIEALACGTQIVASDCPSGSAEILDDGKYGQLVPVGDDHALASALLRSLTGDVYIPPQKLRERAEDFTAIKAAQAYLHRLETPNL